MDDNNNIAPSEKEIWWTFDYAADSVQGVDLTPFTFYPRREDGPPPSIFNPVQLLHW